MSGGPGSVVIPYEMVYNGYIDGTIYLRTGAGHMSDVGIQVKLLVDTLEKKKKLLQELKDYTFQQTELLKNEKFDNRAFK